MENNNYLIHYGVIGMKWGVRRYQNPDGSLKSAGKKRYGNSHSNEDKRNRLTDEQKAKMKRAAVIGASVVATGLAVYGAHKLDIKLTSELSSRAVAEGKRLVSRAFEVSQMASNAGNFADNARKYSDKELSKSAINYFANTAERYRAISDKMYDEGFDLIKKGKEGAFTTSEKVNLLKERLKNRKNAAYKVNRILDLTR